MAYRRRRVTYRRRRRITTTYTPRKRRRQTTTRRAQAKPCACPGELSPGAKWALAQLDPFDSRCFGAKVPDSNTIPSIANADTDILSVSSTAVASDLTGRAYRPFYTQAVCAATSGASLAWGNFGGVGWSNRSKQASYVAAMELIRPIAHAVRLSCPLAPTAASGFVHVGLSTEGMHESTQAIKYPTTIAEMSGLSNYRRFTLASLTQAPVTVINKWLDDTAFRYSASNAGTGTSGTAMSFHTDYAWGTIIIVVEGAPVSSQVLSVEHTLLSEGIPDKNGVIIGTQAAPNAPGILSSVSTMQTETGFTHTEAEQESYIARGVESLVRGAQNEGAAAFEEVAIPLLQRVGGSVARAGMRYAYNMITGRGGLPGVNANPNRLAIT